MFEKLNKVDFSLGNRLMYLERTHNLISFKLIHQCLEEFIRNEISRSGIDGLYSQLYLSIKWFSFRKAVIRCMGN
jgi:hypothetical protein